MRIPFRQGLVRYQTDIANNPTFLAQSPSTSAIDLVVSPTSTFVAFAHGKANYLFEEKRSVSEAWPGPFVTGTDYWLYWDLNIITAERTFGHTTVEPVAAVTAPAAPVQGLHWFDLKNTRMYVWNGITWQETIRVFAGKYESGSVLVPNPVGSQVGISTPSLVGFILFDEDEKPIRKFARGRKSEFLTTESTIATHMSTGIVNFAFETALNIVEAVEPIPEYYLVTNKGVEQIGVASYLNTSSPIIGMVTNDAVTGDFVSYVPRGYITNESWNWTVDPGTSLFCGSTGQPSLAVPQSGVIQEVGHVVNSKTIFLDIKMMIILGSD